MAKAPRRLRDTHLFDHINRIQLAIWALVVIIGLISGDFLLLVLLVVLAGAVILVLPAIQYLSGRVARNIFDPSGDTVPSKPAYSGPESLAVRGRFEDAINAYEAAAREEPHDPEPWLRIARIERGDLKRPQRAMEALRAARTRVADGSATALMIGREIADIYLTDMGEPTRAMPELARLAAAAPDSPIGQWAARELAELKREVKRP